MDWVGDVVFEDGRDVFLGISGNVCREARSWITYLGEVALTVADEQTSLATTAVAHDDDLLGIGRWLRVLCSRGFAPAVRTVDGADCSLAIPRALLPTGLVVTAVAVVVRVAILVRRHNEAGSARRVCLGCESPPRMWAILRVAGR